MLMIGKNITLPESKINIMELHNTTKMHLSLE